MAYSIKMLQNRVNPFGEIIKTSERGVLTGNRGVLHDEQKNIRRQFKLKAWITCLLEFKGWHREVMSPNRWTELFFMDEATAFAAGHRPCFECRREAASRFKACWLQGNPQYGFDAKTSINEIDKILHRERIDGNGAKVTYEELAGNLPDGAFVLYADKPHLVAKGRLFEWSPGGYVANVILPADKKLTVLTPRSTMNAFRAGYVPQMRLES